MKPKLFCRESPGLRVALEVGGWRFDGDGGEVQGGSLGLRPRPDEDVMVYWELGVRAKYCATVLF